MEGYRECLCSGATCADTSWLEGLANLRVTKKPHGASMGANINPENQSIKLDLSSVFIDLTRGNSVAWRNRMQQYMKIYSRAIFNWGVKIRSSELELGNSRISLTCRLSL
jgi:hypothetical protein